MRILVVGAAGLIGAGVVARLSRDGHEVVAAVRERGAAARSLAAEAFVTIDLRRATTPEDWLPHLAGIDAVVNCAGVLQDGPRDSTRAAHVEGIGALFEACEQAGIRRVVHISAIGVDHETPTAFSRTKRAGEELLMGRDLDWIILRPSVVVGRAAYGGSALLRGLAALPVLPLMPGTGPLQVVQLDDLVASIVFFLRPGTPAKQAFDVAGPERLSFAAAVAAYRRWLGWPASRLLRLPAWVAAAMFRLGDLAGLLGWRAPIRSTAQREIARGAVGETAAWREASGIAPQSLEAALASEPSSVQERWFARLYFLKPLAFAVFSLFWIGTGLISLGPGYRIGVDLMTEGGAGPLAGPSVVAGALADIVIGIGIALRRTARAALWAAVAITLFYVVAGTLLVPRLWADPLGPMLKIWPVLALNFVLLAILDER